MFKYSEIIKANSKIKNIKFPHCYNLLKHLVSCLQIISIWNLKIYKPPDHIRSMKL